MLLLQLLLSVIHLAIAQSKFCLSNNYNYCVLTGCLYGQLRLVNGPRPNVGRLEICIEGNWGTICDDDWSEANAQVVCRQLGYSPDSKTLLMLMHVDIYTCSYIK